MAPRAALNKVRTAAVRETAGGSGQARRIQQGTDKRAGVQLKNLETRRAHVPPGRPHSRDGVSRGSKGKRAVREPSEDPDPELNSGSEQEGTEWEGNVGSEEENAGSEETEEDADDDDAEVEANAKRAKRAKRSGKGKVGDKGKKEEVLFTWEEVKALLQKEREKHHRRATPTPPTRPHGDDEFVVPAPAPSSCPFLELDKAAQGELWNSCQTWVRSEEEKGRIDYSKKWRNQEGVNDPNSLLLKGLHCLAGIKGVSTIVMTRLVKIYCESRYVTLTSV